MAVRSRAPGRAASFGTPLRTEILVLLRLLGTSYPRELARLLRRPLSVVQKALASLERDSLVAAQSLGRTRAFRLNPRYYAGRELAAYLSRIAEAEQEIFDLAASVRRRPRRTGKPL
jgi:hypothetical protein